MGYFDSLLGTNIGGNSSAGPNINTGKTAALFSNISELQAIESMLSFLGQNPAQYLQQFALQGKEGKKAFKSDPLTTAKIGGTYYDIGGLLGKKADLAKQADTMALSNAQAKYEQLKQQPMLATLAAQAEGKFDSN